MSEPNKPEDIQKIGLPIETCLSLIRGNLEVWSQMYFDEVTEASTHCFSYLREADSDYYNAAHLVKEWTPQIQKNLESSFSEKEIAPAIFTDPRSVDWLPEQLMAQGYVPLPEITECYEVYPLTPERVANLQQLSPLKIDPARCEIVKVEPNKPEHREDFEHFLRIDQETNEISHPVLAQLRHNLKHRHHPEVTLILLLGKVDGTPAFTGSVGIYRKMAFLAEGGTLEPFRRMGLHAAMLKERLLLAAQHGATMGCFTCFEGAASGLSAEKIGFFLPFRRYLYKKL